MVRHRLLPVAAFVFLCGSISGVPAAQTDPTTLPRLQLADLVYVGAFRLPSDAAASFAYGGQAIAFNPAGPSLFVSTMHNTVAEVSIPAPVNSTNVAALPFASFRQGFSDPTEGRLSEVWSNGVQINSLLVKDNRLLCTAFVYYDAMGDARFSHCARDLNLTTKSFSGWSTLEWKQGETLVKRPGFVAGSLAHVPPEWQSLLGGSVVSGLCCVPIVSRTSYGPSNFAFDGSRIGQAVVPAFPLLYYPFDHTTLGPWQGSNETWGASSEVGGMVLVAGTRTALYFGRNGLGPYCYGAGTADKTKVGTTDPDGTFWCYDPTSLSKGIHSYPYRYQIWAYDLSDFAAVKAGTKKPWEVVPYGVWPLTLPIIQDQVSLGGVTYDAASQTIYLSQRLADTDRYDPRPIIHTLKVNVAASVPTPSTNTTPPTPDPPPPPTDPTADELKALLVSLQAQVADLSAKFAIAQANLVTAQSSLTASNATRDAALVRIAAIKVEAKMILDRNAGLKPNSRLPKWATDALDRIMVK